MKSNRRTQTGPGPRTGAGLHDDDPVVGEWLASLDPGRDDDLYWSRFHGRVLARAGGELARRRAAAQPTVMDFVSSWSRALVPAALTAAAVAGFLLVQPGAPPSETAARVDVEELLAEGLGEDPVPARPFTGPSGSEALAVFAGEIF